MTIIKLLLVVALLLLGLYAARQGGGGPQLALRRLLGALVLLAGIVAVLWPSTTVWLANLVGVRRGTDLVIYTAIVAFGFVAVSLHARVRVLQEQLTTTVRELALHEARTAPLPGLAEPAPGPGPRS